MNELLTIFTPTYNRADKLPILYQSLKKQTNKQFIWMIVDDGSTDRSQDMVKAFVSDSDFNIEYYYQKNHGKHVAHNLGVSKCNTTLFFCVDSDDWLVETAVDDIIRCWNGIVDKNNLSGIIAWKGFSETEKIGSYPDSMEPASLSELYDERKMSGDTALIFCTSVIKQFPFPVVENERFLRESLAYNVIDRHHKYIILNKILYIADYYDDGLSKNATKLELENPIGAAMFRWNEYENTKERNKKFRNLIAYVFFNRIGNNNQESHRRLGWRFNIFYLLSFSGDWRYRKLRKEIRKMAKK